MHGRFQSTGAGETEALGARLADELGPGDVVLVQGELGAGKTTFVRGAARALGVTAPVTSPTFTIGQLYRPARRTDGDSAGARGPAAVAHVDLYRLGSLTDEEPDLLADYLRADTVAFVEWPAAHEDELAALARVAARVRLEHAGGDRRLVVLG
ncbi:MAG: tRNA (adenosine(37)-N6)-threonylcarbamoyltransferase complex ATPase subunit type 1 TsaE [Solirubrobacteraceae bacterium]